MLNANIINNAIETHDLHVLNIDYYNDMKHGKSYSYDMELQLHETEVFIH